jgi:hypothetical protein
MTWPYPLVREEAMLLDPWFHKPSMSVLPVVVEVFRCQMREALDESHTNEWCCWLGASLALDIVGHDEKDLDRCLRGVRDGLKNELSLENILQLSSRV